MSHKPASCGSLQYVATPRLIPARPTFHPIAGRVIPRILSSIAPHSIKLFHPIPRPPVALIPTRLPHPVPRPPVAVIRQRKNKVVRRTFLAICSCTSLYSLA